MTKKYLASDEFIAWAQSLSGMLTKIRTTYGGAAEMIESPHWNESKTSLALALVASLKREIAELHAEMDCHVKEKLG